MDEREKVDPLKELGDRLDKARQARRPARETPPQEGTSAALALGWRIGLELVVAVVVGVFIGWAIDKGLGTRPWGMIGFFFLGVAAGMVNVYRTVTGLGMAMGYRRGGKSDTGAGWEEDED
jgi:ATP synthase protein I